jgi:hypothetical protein
MCPKMTDKNLKFNSTKNIPKESYFKLKFDREKVFLSYGRN